MNRATFPDSFSDTPGLTRLRSNEPGKVLKFQPSAAAARARVGALVGVGRSLAR